MAGLFLSATGLASAAWRTLNREEQEQQEAGEGHSVASGVAEGYAGVLDDKGAVPLFVIEGNMGLEAPVVEEVALRLREWNQAHGKHEALDPRAVKVTPTPWGFLSLVLISVPPSWVGGSQQEHLYQLLLGLRSIHEVMRFEFQLELPVASQPVQTTKAHEAGKQGQPASDGLTDEPDTASNEEDGAAGMNTGHAYLDQLHAALWRPENVLRCMTSPKPASFRVTATRYSHNKAFTSQEIARVAGDALHERYHVPADMKNYAVNVRVIALGGDKALIASQLNAETLSKRHKEVFVNHVTTRSNIAYVMYALAQVPEDGMVLDPFCGSATILLEALAASSGNLECHGVDYSPKAIKGATRNAEIEGVLDHCHFHKGDARTLTKLFEPRSFDAIVTNPPWGVRSGCSTDLDQLYTIFLHDTARIIKPGGVMVVFLLKAMLFVELVRMTGKWTIEASYVVKTRNNLPTVFVLRQREDVEKGRIMAGLNELSPYCSLSSDLFWSIRNKEGVSVGPRPAGPDKRKKAKNATRQGSEAKGSGHK